MVQNNLKNVINPGVDLYKIFHVCLSMFKFSNIGNTGKSLFAFIGSSKVNRLGQFRFALFILKVYERTTTDCACH